MDILNFMKQDCLPFQLLTFQTSNKRRKDFKHKKLNSEFQLDHTPCTICVYFNIF